MPSAASTLPSSPVSVLALFPHCFLHHLERRHTSLLHVWVLLGLYHAFDAGAVLARIFAHAAQGLHSCPPHIWVVVQHPTGDLPCGVLGMRPQVGKALNSGASNPPVGGLQRLGYFDEEGGRIGASAAK